MQKLMIDDLKNEINEIRAAELVDEIMVHNNDDEKPSKVDLNNSYSPRSNAFDNVDGSDSIKDDNDGIKMEIKSEKEPTCDNNNKCEMLKNIDHNDKQQTFHINNIKSKQLDVQNNVKHEEEQQQQQSSSKPFNSNSENKNNNNADKVKEEFEHFDIESEITPSFIMKKVENKKETTTALQGSSKVQANDKEKSFNDVYLASNNNNNNKNKNYDVQLEQQTSQVQIHTKLDQEQEIQQIKKSFEKADKTEMSTIQASFTSPQQQQQQQYSQQQSKVQQQQQQQDDDEWISIQKELNLINEAKVQQQQQQQELQPQKLQSNLYESSNPTANNHHITNGVGGDADLFPNGCINGNKQQQQHSDNDSIGEFFDSTDDDEVQRSVETRLEAMFGESPVPLSGADKNDNDTHDDIESGLEEIFGHAKSPIIPSETGVNILDAIKNKRLWENEMASGNNFMRHDRPQQQKHFYNNTSNNSPQEQQQQQQQQYVTNNQEQQQAHHIQLNCNNNPRWMQTMEAQYTNDFNGTININGDNDVGICSENTRKRQWNHHGDLLSGNNFVSNEHDDEHDDDVEHGAPRNKKLCNTHTDFSVASSSMSSSSSSSSSASSISAASASPVLQEQQQQLQQQQQQQQQQQHVSSTMTHQHEIIDTNLLLHDDMRVVDVNSSNNVGVNAEFAQLLHQQQQQQPSQLPGPQQNHFNVEQQQQQFGDILMNNVDMMAHNQQHHNHQHHYNNMHQIEQPQELQQIQQQQQLIQQQQQSSLVNTTNNHVEFDDDISRHVQNAIDSILNLQNSESDSLPFSLDHSMGSLLGDSILDDRQSTNNTTALVTANMVPPTMSNQCQAATVNNGGMLEAPSTINNAEGVSGGIINNKRAVNLVDDLSDCLISGASQCGDNASNILLTHQQYQQQQQQQQYTHNNISNHHEPPQQLYHQQNSHLPQGMIHQSHHQHQQQQQQQPQQSQSIITTGPAPVIPEVLNDFSCMVANIDEAVKSIMGS